MEIIKVNDEEWKFDTVPCHMVYDHTRDIRIGDLVIWERFQIIEIDDCYMTMIEKEVNGKYSRQLKTFFSIENSHQYLRLYGVECENE